MRSARQLLRGAVGQHQLAGGAHGHLDLDLKLAALDVPRRRHAAQDRLDAARGPGQAAAHHRRHAHAAIPRLNSLDARHARVQEVADRAAGVVVVGNHHVGAVVADGALAVLVQAVPALPNGGRALRHLVEPRGALGVEQHLVRHVGAAVVCQGKQDVRRAGEAGANAVIALLHQLDQVVHGGRLVLLAQHAKVNGQHVGGLELVLELACAIGKDVLVGGRDARRQGAVALSVVLLAQNVGDLGHQRACVLQASRGGPLAAGLPLAHLGHIGGHPVAKVQRCGRVPDVAVLAQAKAGPKTAGIDVAAHHVVVLAQDLDVALGAVKGPRHQHARVAPKVDGHRGHRGREAKAACGHRVGNAAAAQLLGAHVAQPFAQEAAHVKVVAGRGRKDGDVARPAHALVSLRAVGGDLDKVRARRPLDVLLQAVDLLV